MALIDNTSMELDIAAALAQKLAQDYRNGAMWPGDTQRIIDDIRQHLAKAERTIPSSR